MWARQDVNHKVAPLQELYNDISAELYNFLSHRTEDIHQALLSSSSSAGLWDHRTLPLWNDICVPLLAAVFSKFIQWNLYLYCWCNRRDRVNLWCSWPLLSSMYGNSLQLSGHIRTKPRVWRGTSAVALVRGGRWGEYTSDGLAGLQLLLQLVIIIMAETRVPFLVPLPRAFLWPRLMFAFCKWTLDARAVFALTYTD